jgi:hypothetical protein
VSWTWPPFPQEAGLVAYFSGAGTSPGAIMLPARKLRNSRANRDEHEKALIAMCKMSDRNHPALAETAEVASVAIIPVLRGFPGSETFTCPFGCVSRRGGA